MENAKVARRVSNQEICEFWSKKILPEQYVLYNLRQAAPECFPLTKQGTSSYLRHLTTDSARVAPIISLNIYHENFNSNIDKVTKDLPFVNRD